MYKDCPANKFRGMQSNSFLSYMDSKKQHGVSQLPFSVGKISQTASFLLLLIIRHQHRVLLEIWGRSKLSAIPASVFSAPKKV